MKGDKDDPNLNKTVGHGTKQPASPKELGRLAYDQGDRAKQKAGSAKAGRPKSR